jgi:hypothetical protein
MSMTRRVLVAVAAPLAAVVLAAPGAARADRQPAAAEAPASGAPIQEEEEFWTRGKIVSAGALGGVYAGITVWAYFAWYHNKPRNLYFKVGGDGLFGVNTYAGGSDKLGHFWSNLMVSRVTTELLIAGGWKPLPASLIASGLSSAFFTFVEVKDGYYYEFSTGDLVADVGGAALSVLMINVPEVDRLFDFRVDYLPTSEYLDGFGDGDVNFAEDYTGQTYLLATHLSGIPGLTDSKWTRWARYIDLVGGYQSVNYKPDPVDMEAVPSQHLFLGAAFNVQTLLEDLYGQPAERGQARVSHQIAHNFFELVSVPYTTLRVVEAERSQSGM